jgi:hypothetical protein
MTPRRGPYERRRYGRAHMATRDCRLILIRRWGERREREICTLVDVSYAGLRFHPHRALGVGEMVELLIEIRSPVQRAGFVQASVRWSRILGFEEYDVGVEFSGETKGLLLGPNEILPTAKQK